MQVFITNIIIIVNKTTNIELLEYAIPQGATTFTKSLLHCFIGDDNYDDFCAHFAFLSRTEENGIFAL